MGVEASQKGTKKYTRWVWDGASWTRSLWPLHYICCLPISREFWNTDLRPVVSEIATHTMRKDKTANSDVISAREDRNNIVIGY